MLFLHRKLPLGEFSEGIGHGEESVRIAEAVDHPFSLVEAYRGIGYLYLRKGDLHRAIPVLERGLSLCRVAAIPMWSSWFTPALGYAYTLSGQVTEGMALFEQGASMGMTFWRQLYWFLVLSEAYLLAGRLEDATHQDRQALDLARAL